MRRRPQIALLALASALAIAFAVAVSLSGSSRSSRAPAETSRAGGEPAFAGAALPGASAPDFTLRDQRGRAVRLSHYRGSVTVLAFLYSTCGATCEVLAQQVRGALDDLPRPVPVLFVSADPAADTPTSVRRFLARVSLAGRARYLTGSPSQLRPLWRAFGVSPAAGGASAFKRSASVLLIDARGRERVLFGLEELTPESLAHDISRLEGGPTRP